MKEKKLVFYEPWGLGDALIALRAIKSISNLNSKAYLLINPRWKNIISSLIEKDSLSLNLLLADIGYTNREKKKHSSFLFNLNETIDVDQVFSIRGDPRDLFVFQTIFPYAEYSISGYENFILRRSNFIDKFFLFFSGQVKNRYALWENLLNQFFTFSQLPIISHSQIKKIMLHRGAQWKSKSYPFFDDLTLQLSKSEYSVSNYCGPNELKDLESNYPIEECSDYKLIQNILNNDLIICNDSSALHLSSYLGRKVLAIARSSNILEWIPPGAHYVASDQMPLGYYPDKNYQSDKILDAWPSSASIIQHVKNL